jgi:DNA-binding CsgD family transcriptional regulator
MLAIGARCRSLVFAARGDLASALDSARQAMGHHDRLPMPFERSRTGLLMGQLQRRRRQRDAASSTLTAALDEFERLGAPIWAERARAELERARFGAKRVAVLTASERRVAELVATGMTNRDVASALFISPKTVEGNLARVYRKLGIRSRAELGRYVEHEKG